MTEGWKIRKGGETVSQVRKVYTRNGQRLEIRSVRTGEYIRLDALALESLTWQSPETLAGLRRGGDSGHQGTGVEKGGSINER